MAVTPTHRDLAAPERLLDGTIVETLLSGAEVTSSTRRSGHTPLLLDPVALAHTDAEHSNAPECQDTQTFDCDTWPGSEDDDEDVGGGDWDDDEPDDDESDDDEPDEVVIDDDSPDEDGAGGDWGDDASDEEGAGGDW